MKSIVKLFLAGILFIGAGCSTQTAQVSTSVGTKPADLAQAHELVCTKQNLQYYQAIGTNISLCLTEDQRNSTGSTHVEVDGDGTAEVYSVLEGEHAKIHASSLTHQASGDEVAICYDCLKPTSSIEELRTALHLQPQDTITKTEVGGKFAVKAHFDAATIYLIPQAYPNYNVYIYGDGAAASSEADAFAKNIWFDVKKES